jgi:RNA polymerase sigma-70 factor (ECF subfamily)
LHEGASLLQQIAAGDQQACNSFYHLFYKKVMATAFHYLQQQQEAEETVQDVFLAVFRAAARYNPTAAPDTWVYRIAVNKCLDRLRYRKARAHIRSFAALLGVVPDRATTNTEQEPPAGAENLLLLYRSINQLPERQKTALILTQLQELSLRQAAEVMQTTPKAVESLTMRAKANLKKYMIPTDRRK